MRKIEQSFLKENSRLRPGGKYEKTSITIHSTANERSTAENERAWLDNAANTRDASWHYAVGESRIIQAIPDEEEAWHCSVKDGNRHSISIEICESGNRQAAAENAAYLAAEKLKEHGLRADCIKQHYDWNGKNCPRILRDKRYVKDNVDWQWFIDRVKLFMEDDEDMIYEKLEDIPEWGRPTVEKLIKKGYIAGDEKGRIALSEMSVKVLVINDRAGLYE